MKHYLRCSGPALALLVAAALASAGTLLPKSVTGTVGDDTIFLNGFGEAPDVVRARKGFEIAPVPLDLVDHDPLLVGLGSYLVNAVGSCNDCHTNPPFAAGGNPYLGQPMQINAANYLGGGQAFGPFLSRNITPQANGLPAGRTYEEFVQIMRHGIDFECAPGDPPPCPLLQVMPWPLFQDMSDVDLQAIYEYLSVIPHAEPGT